LWVPRHRSIRNAVHSIALVDVSEGATFSVPAADPDNDTFQIINVMDSLCNITHQPVKQAAIQALPPGSPSLNPNQIIQNY